MCLVAATWLHAGFQVVITTLVYPTFRDIDDHDWSAFHLRHSRRISGVVALVYGALVTASAGVLVLGAFDFATAATLAAIVLAFVVTATVAAPAHGRLASGRATSDVAVLLLGDKVRCVAAVVAAAVALWAALSR